MRPRDSRPVNRRISAGTSQDTQAARTAAPMRNATMASTWPLARSVCMGRA